MAITTMDGLVAALAGSKQNQNLFFLSVTAAASGWFNLNQAASPSFGTMATPAALGSGGTAYDQSGISTGFPKWSAASGGNTSFIARLESTFAVAGTMHIYDLLYAASGFSGTVSTAQTITSPVAFPARSNNGIGAEIWLGCSSAIGATQANVTVQYTNSSGVSGRNTVALGTIASMASTRMMPLSLQAGDTGVQSVQGLTLAASTGTTGNLWVMVMRRVASIAGTAANLGLVHDFAALGLPVVDDNASLLFVNQTVGSITGNILGQFSVIQG